MFCFPSFNPEKDVIAYKSFMLADRMEAQWSQNSQNVLLLMVFTFYHSDSLILHFNAFLRVIFTKFHFCRQFKHSISTLLQFHELII